MKHSHLLLLICLLTAACRSGITIDTEKPEQPAIYPDYAGVTIPPNIAPLTFMPDFETTEGEARLSFGGFTITAKLSDKGFRPDIDDWHSLLDKAKGNEISVKVVLREDGKWVGYAPFTIYVDDEPIDRYLSYRLIAPNYITWNKMGLYQRDLTCFKEKPIVENNQTDINCMNCHSFCNRDGSTMLFHMRGRNAGTYIIRGKEIEKLETKTPQTISPLVYPSWNPDGRHIAFSVNETYQSFHPSDRNRIEVFDTASDVVVYDSETHTISTSPLLSSPERFETFPTFSPGGDSLYFCSAEARPREEFRDVKYSLCRIAYDHRSGTFGTTVDTLFNAETEQRSASFPRVSPDGKSLMFTVSSYGNFTIWHKDADLYLLDIATGKYHALSNANSNDVESYHSWSSDSRWFVFSSRRDDGLYTVPYFAMLLPDGTTTKPFALPQSDATKYRNYLFSYNIPELTRTKIEVSEYKISLEAKNGTAHQIEFR